MKKYKSSHEASDAKKMTRYAFIKKYLQKYIDTLDLRYFLYNNKKHQKPLSIEVYFYEAKEDETYNPEIAKLKG